MPVRDSLCRPGFVQKAPPDDRICCSRDLQDLDDHLPSVLVACLKHVSRRALAEKPPERV
jgi:hypothetical protein